MTVCGTAGPNMLLRFLTLLHALRRTPHTHTDAREQGTIVRGRGLACESCLSSSTSIPLTEQRILVIYDTRKGKALAELPLDSLEPPEGGGASEGVHDRLKETPRVGGRPYCLKPQGLQKFQIISRIKSNYDARQPPPCSARREEAKNNVFTSIQQLGD